MRCCRLSVVIPALNEEATIEAAVSSALHSQPLENPAWVSEVLVVDGGSLDNTVSRAKLSGAKVLVALPGRASQMNVGWQQAKGGCILFLHADSRLPPDYRSMVQKAAEHSLKSSRCAPVWGCFETINADAGSRLESAILKHTVRARTWLRHMPYGDQAIFVRADVLRQLGGFKEIPIMEDYELVTRLRKHGRPAIIPHAITTSGRRWRSVGFLQTTLINQAMVVAFHCGVPMKTLVQWYRGFNSAAG